MRPGGPERNSVFRTSERALRGVEIDGKGSAQARSILDRDRMDLSGTKRSARRWLGADDIRTVCEIDCAEHACRIGSHACEFNWRTDLRKLEQNHCHVLDWTRTSCAREPSNDLARES